MNYNWFQSKKPNRPPRLAPPAPPPPKPKQNPIEHHYETIGEIVRIAESQAKALQNEADALALSTERKIINLMARKREQEKIIEAYSEAHEVFASDLNATMTAEDNVDRAVAASIEELPAGFLDHKPD